MLAAKAGNGKTAKLLREASGEPEPEKPVEKPKPDDPMAADGWLGSANLEAKKQGGGRTRSKGNGKNGKKKK